MERRFSAAMSGDVESALFDHLARPDGQEDLCFAIWRPSIGMRRLTALLSQPVWPRHGERHVHGNASFETEYTLRAAQEAADAGGGLVLLHAHPGAYGWQAASGPDHEAEASIANLARELTQLPLVGITLATEDRSWSARLWNMGAGRSVSYEEAETVRVVADTLRVSFNEHLLPREAPSQSLVRTVSAWGEDTQALVSRLRILVVGAGSVGGIVAERLARTGVRTIGLMDYDSVEFVNLDRLLGASSLDARLHRSKVEVAARVVAESATATNPVVEVSELSVCEAAGLESSLDYDLILSCVDRPWPRHVLNTIAYADLIPVLDGGVSVKRLTDGRLRNAYWRSHIARPGSRCLACLSQYDPALVQVERDGSLDTPSYVDNLPVDSPLKESQNVAVFSVAAASSLLTHLVSFLVAPSGLGDPGPLKYSLASHTVERDRLSCEPGCPYSGDTAVGDYRVKPTGRHQAAERARDERQRSHLGFGWKIREAVGRLIARFCGSIWRGDRS